MPPSRGLSPAVPASRRGGPDFSREGELIRCGEAPVAGVDEVGRGPLAGPVVAAAVILDPGRLPAGLADSKVLSASRRESLFEAITASAHVGIGSLPAPEIDRLNIRRATHAAMRLAIAALPVSPAIALVDGNDAPALQCPATAIVKGDALVLSIAAASIIAKVVRDRMMARLDAVHPGYGFAAHAGYPTALHRAALARLGPCGAHRLSFAPLRDLAGPA